MLYQTRERKNGRVYSEVRGRITAFKLSNTTQSAKFSSAFLFRCRAVTNPPVCCIRMAEKGPPVMVAQLVNVEDADQRARCKAFQEFLE